MENINSVFHTTQNIGAGRAIPQTKYQTTSVSLDDKTMRVVFECKFPVDMQMELNSDRIWILRFRLNVSNVQTPANTRTTLAHTNWMNDRFSEPMSCAYCGAGARFPSIHIHPVREMRVCVRKLRTANKFCMRCWNMCAEGSDSHSIQPIAVDQASDQAENSEYEMKIRTHSYYDYFQLRPHMQMRKSILCVMRRDFGANSSLERANRIQITCKRVNWPTVRVRAVRTYVQRIRYLFLMMSEQIFAE